MRLEDETLKEEDIKSAEDLDVEMLDEILAKRDEVEAPKPAPEGKRTEAQKRASKKFYATHRDAELARTKRYQQGVDNPETRERYLAKKREHYYNVEKPRRQRRAAEAKAAKKAAQEAAANG